MSGLSEVIAELARALRDVMNLEAAAAGDVPSAQKRRELMLELTTSRTVLRVAELTVLATWDAERYVAQQTCPSCGKPGAGFCADCRATAARLAPGDE